MLGEFIETDWRGEMSGSFDVEQLLVDNLQVLGTPLTGAVKKKGKKKNIISQKKPQNTVTLLAPWTCCKKLSDNTGYHEEMLM